MAAVQNPDNTPAQGLQGSSYLYEYGTSPNTRAAVSQKVRVLTPAYGNQGTLSQAGVVSSWAPTESRTIDELRGIGFGDKIAELVPSITGATTATFERALLYLSNLWQTTGYAAGVDGPVRSLRHHRWPFDVEQQLVFSSLADFDLNGGIPNTGAKLGGFQGGTTAIQYPSVYTSQKDQTQGSHTAIITMYEACWFNSWSATFSKDAGQIMESGGVTISDVHDFNSTYGEFLATGNDPTIGQLGSIRYLGGAFTTGPTFGTTGGGAVIG